MEVLILRDLRSTMGIQTKPAGSSKIKINWPILILSAGFPLKQLHQSPAIGFCWCVGRRVLCVLRDGGVWRMYSYHSSWVLIELYTFADPRSLQSFAFPQSQPLTDSCSETLVMQASRVWMRLRKEALRRLQSWLLTSNGPGLRFAPWVASLSVHKEQRSLRGRGKNTGL